MCAIPTGASAQSQLDPAFAPSLNGSVDSLAVLQDGRIMFGGQFTQVSGSPIYAVARTNSAGVLELAYNPQVDMVYDVSTGRLLAGIKSIGCALDSSAYISGWFNVYEGFTSYQIARQGPNGFIDRYFRAYENFSAINSSGFAYIYTVPYCMSLQNGQALMWGYFIMEGSLQQPGLARLTNSPYNGGQPDASFQPSLVNSGGSVSVYSVAEQPDGNILIGGYFTQAGGLLRSYIARVSNTGTGDAQFNANADGDVDCIALQGDGKVLVAGYFSSIGGQVANGFARLMPNGSADTTFTPVVSRGVTSICPRADGKILVGGAFTLGTGQANLALLNADGTLATEFGKETFDSSIRAVAIQGDGSALIGGNFTSVSGSVRNRLARLTATTPAVQTLSVDPDGRFVEWTRTGSTPEVKYTQFEQSSDGVTYTTIGMGARTATGWQLASLKLPAAKKFYIRARGPAPCSYYNASTSMMETEASFIRPAPVINTQPVKATAIVGDPGVQFSVTATSAATLSYQWRKSGVNITGATSSSYTIPHLIGTTDAGTYTVLVSSTAGAIVSSGAVLTVIVPIHITVPPASQHVGVGKPVTFKVTVTGTAPVYEWRYKEIKIPGATAATYTLNNCQKIINEGNYTVAVTNYAGTVESDPATLTAIAPPTVSAPPATQLVQVGQASPALSATVVSDEPPQYQWLKNGVKIAGATGATFTIGNAQLVDFGKYSVVVTNVGGVATSGTADVGVVDTLHQMSPTFLPGTAATLTAAAAGNNLTYAWKFKGTYLVETAGRYINVKSKVVTIKGLVSPDDSGAYTCEVTGPGSDMLETAALNVAVTTLTPAVDTLTLAPPNGMVGSLYYYKIPVDANVLRTPAKYTVTGLPTGLLLNAVTGEITGRPLTAKLWPITIKLTNPAGSSATISSSITIQSIPGGAVGSFLALVDRDAGLAANQGGLVSLTSLATGAYSGKLTLGTAVYPFLGGKLDIGLDFTGAAFNHTNNIVILRKGLPSLTLSFDVDPVTSLLTGHLSDGGSVNAAVTGFRNTWNATSAKPDHYTGYYTFTLTPPAQPPSGPGHPPGYGYGSFIVSAAGALTVSGKQGDGTAYTTPGFLGPNGEVLIYQGLYSTTGGSVAGQLTVTPGGVAPVYASSTVAGTPSLLKGSQTAIATAHTYRDGFGPISITAAGTKYTTVTTGQNLLGVDTLTNDAAFTFTGASVETAVQNPSILVRISDKNVIIPPTLASGNNPAKLTATVSASTGVFSGSFTLVDDTDPSPTRLVNLTRTGSFGGIVVRDPAGLGVGHGWFLLPQLSGSPTTSTAALNVLGGTVTLDKAP